MKDQPPKDRAASVRARLLNLARERREDFQITLRNYLFERFLYRLSLSEVRERFILKGAMLLRLWADQPYRATVDLDLLSRGHNDPDSVARDIAAICSTAVPDDTVVFDAATISVEPIRAEEEYSGVRALFDARLGTIRERLQIDVGFGDALWPQAEKMTYPVALGDPAPMLRTYRPETVIAEKLEAIVSLGIRNSRIKDFFDIDYLARTERFDRVALIEAIQRTFERRGTLIPTETPIGLTPEFWSQPGRDAQVKAFARRARLPTTTESAAELGLRVAAFAIPLLQAASQLPAGNAAET
jgi:predicted nucleotidyltransferase component of viral defense system